MANFNRDLKSMVSFTGKKYNGDVSETMKAFNWKPYALQTTVLGTAKSVQEVLNRN